MASQKQKRPAITEVATAISVVTQLNEIFLALGRAVTALQKAQKVVGEDKSTLNTSVLELHAKIVDVQKRQSHLMADLKKAGVLAKSAK